MATPTAPNGGVAKDPTQNVIDSLNAATARLDDLIALHNSSNKELFDEKVRGMKELMELRAAHQNALMLAESRRIDAIRTVDVNAGTIANERAATQAQTLQAQVASSAETLRALVATTATAVASQLVQTITPITDRLSVLERAQYEFKGSSSVADPATSAALAQMADAIKNLSVAQDIKAGSSTGSSNTIAMMVTIISVIFGLTGAIGVVFTLLRHS